MNNAEKANCWHQVCHSLSVNTGNLWFIVKVYHEYLILLSQDCEVIMFLSVWSAYEDSIASRYSDDKSNESHITGIDST
jgi:hypothetical protein